MQTLHTLYDVINEASRRAREDKCCRVVYACPSGLLAIGLCEDDLECHLLDRPICFAHANGEIENI